MDYIYTVYKIKFKYEIKDLDLFFLSSSKAIHPISAKNYSQFSLNAILYLRIHLPAKGRIASYPH